MTRIATARQIAFGFHANLEPNARSLPGRINRIGVQNEYRARGQQPPIATPDAIARVIVQPWLAFRTHAQASSVTMNVASGSVMNMPEYRVSSRLAEGWPP